MSVSVLVGATRCWRQMRKRWRRLPLCCFCRDHVPVALDPSASAPIAPMASAARMRHIAGHVGGNGVALVRETISPQR